MYIATYPQGLSLLKISVTYLLHVYYGEVFTFHIHVVITVCVDLCVRTQYVLISVLYIHLHIV